MAAGSIHYYRTVSPDLFMVALAAASTMTVVTIGFGYILFRVTDTGFDGAFVLGLSIVAEVAGTAKWLRHEMRPMR